MKTNNIQWFEAQEYGICCGTYTVARATDFISVLSNLYTLGDKGGDILLVTIGDDGLPHEKRMWSYHIIDTSDGLDELNEEVMQRDLDGDIYESYTLDNCVILIEETK